MFDTILGRYGARQFRLATITRLRDLTDRQLADIGIERINIATTARQTARADRRPRPIPRSAKRFTI